VIIVWRVRKRLDDDDDDDNNDDDDEDDDDDSDDINEEEEEEEEEEQQSAFLPSNRRDVLLQPSVLRILSILAHDGASMPPAGERCRFCRVTAGVLISTLPGISADSPLLPQSAASAMPNI